MSSFVVIMDRGRSIRKRTDDDLIAKRSQEITMYKGERWYKLFVIAKAMDETMVAPPEPDPYQCSLSKRDWNKALFKWKYDTIHLYDPDTLPS